VILQWSHGVTLIQRQMESGGLDAAVHGTGKYDGIAKK